MKYLGLIILVFLLFMLHRLNAQTASTRPVSDFYSQMVKQKIEAGQHVVPDNAQQNLPSEKPVPSKVKKLGINAHVPEGKGDEKKLPGNASVDINKVKDRNRKFIRS